MSWWWCVTAFNAGAVLMYAFYSLTVVRNLRASVRHLHASVEIQRGTITALKAIVAQHEAPAVVP